MLKFIVVVTRREDLSFSEFRSYFVDTHGPLAEQIPGLRRYRQNFPADDPNRTPPRWDAVVELFFDDYDAMQQAWATEEGQRASRDLGECADLDRTSWSIVEERLVL